MEGEPTEHNQAELSPDTERPEHMLDDEGLAAAKTDLLDLLGATLSPEDIDELQGCVDGVELFSFAVGFLEEHEVDAFAFFAERGLLE